MKLRKDAVPGGRLRKDDNAEVRVVICVRLSIS